MDVNSIELDISIKEVGLSTRAINCLVRNGIETLGDLSEITAKKLRKTQNLGDTTFNEIVAKMNEYGVSFKTEKTLRQQEEEQNFADAILSSSDKDSEKNGVLDTPIKEVGLSTRAINCLVRNGIETLGDLSEITAKELRKTRKLGDTTFDEIVAKMETYGVSFREEETLEQRINSKKTLLIKLLEKQEYIKKQDRKIAAIIDKIKKELEELGVQNEK